VLASAALAEPLRRRSCEQSPEALVRRSRARKGHTGSLRTLVRCPPEGVELPCGGSS
jgi:hypothetical protein